LPKYAMVIDLHRCAGCGACAIACKGENNVPDGITWADFITKTEGTFPDVTYSYLPTLCNHCDNAPCVAACPVDPKAIFKTESGMTLNSAERCIGCRSCQNACPYGVISFNADEPHGFWQDEKGREVTDKVGGTVIPHYNPNRAMTWDGSGIRPKMVVEKCSFCDHRVSAGKTTYCSESCPCNARIFGDLEDPESLVSKLLRDYEPFRLQEDLGTEPRVYYIRKYNKK
jgi:Fe-S-cluster-containing dehydrogenase component